MSVVGMLAGCQMRRRWRRVAALIVLVGAVGAVILAAAAGARRSETALARFSAASRSGDVSLLPALGYTPTPEQMREVRHVPNVAAAAVVRFYALMPVHAPAGLSPAAAVDGAMGSVVDRSRLIAGRRANPAAPDEATIGEVLATQLHQGVGGHIDFLSYTTAQFAAATSEGGTGRPLPAPEGPRVRVRIVGIVRRPGDLGDADAGGGVVVLTPAFDHRYFDQIGNFGVEVDIRTSHGASDVPRVIAATRPIFAQSGGLSVQGAAESTGGAQSAIEVLTLALWIFAGVAALAGAVAIGIVLTREISLTSVDQETLRSLGVTRPQRVLTSGPQALFVAAGGGLLAVVGAVAASPLFPFGVARRADPDPGFHIDWVVLALGVSAVATFVLVIALAGALRNTRRSAVDATSEARRRPSRVVERAARAGMAPAATNGLRMALEPGRGKTAVPVRSAYLGAVFGVLGVTAVLVFASSLDHLVATPRLFGSTWDFQARDTNFNPTPTDNGCDRNAFGLAREPGVGAVAAVCTNDVQLDGDPVTGWGFTPVRGSIGPEVVAGRAPRASGEVALGSVTLEALGKRIGDTVQGHGPNGTTHYRIVGQVVFPKLGDPQALADGAAFTGAGLSRVFDSNNSYNRFLLGRVAPGSDRAAVERRIAALPGLGKPAGSTVPVEVDRLRRIGWLPAILAALLASLALVAVGHALVTGVRRRRHDLALLKTLGFNRSQVRATVAWQATTLATIGLVIGIPAGLIVGRTVWGLVADGLGVTTTVAIPTLALFLVTLGAVVLVNLVAYLPARSAAGTRPAVALRTE
ncbi:MAG: FtsX-like permease family protein [Acidimicrobiia bacterium]